MLNTIALWDKPPLDRSILIDGKKRNKSAIRTDWRTQRRSPYNVARDALPAFRNLIGRIDARWLLISYSTDGNMPLEGMLRVLAERGRLTLFAERYKRYRVSTQRMSPRSHNTEFVAVVDTGAKSHTHAVDEMLSSLSR